MIRGDTIQYVYTDAAHSNPLRRVRPLDLLDGQEDYDREKYRGMLLKATETMLGYFGFDRTAYGDTPTVCCRGKGNMPTVRKTLKEPHASHSFLSDFILGTQDGLVNVLGILLGVTAATSDMKIIFVATFAALGAESIYGCSRLYIDDSQTQTIPQGGVAGAE